MLARRLLVPLLALLASAGAAGAQRRTRFELTDEDVEPLRAAIPARAALVRWLLANGRDYRREMDAVVPYAYVPPGARYDGQCSHGRLGRPASGGHLVFTMPAAKTDLQIMEQMYGNAAAAEAKRAGGDVAQAMQTFSRIVTAGQEELEARTAPVHAWYRSHGFRYGKGEPATDASWLTREASEGFRIMIAISTTNEYPRDPYCNHLNGPMITVMRTHDADDGWPREVALRQRLSKLPVDEDAPVIRSEVEEEYAAALHEAGLTDAELEDLLTLVFEMRRDLALAPDSASRPATVASVQRERLDANLAWMRRHASTMEPLLQTLHDAYDTVPAKERRTP